MSNKEPSAYKTEQNNATTESVGNNVAIAETVETTLVATAGAVGTIGRQLLLALLVLAYQHLFYLQQQLL